MYMHFTKLLLFILTLTGPTLSWATEPIRVGVFNNKPIVYYEDSSPRGLFVEVLDDTAKKEKWAIEYVYCEVGDCIKRLKNNDLDLVTSLGESPERLKIFDFSKEPVWTFWGTVYSKDRSISSILDLSGRKIAVRKNTKTTRALKKILKEFNLDVVYVEYDNYEEAFDGLRSDKIETVAVNNSYAFANIDVQSGIHKTPIVFNPFSAFFCGQ